MGGDPSITHCLLVVNNRERLAVKEAIGEDCSTYYGYYVVVVSKFGQVEYANADQFDGKGEVGTEVGGDGVGGGAAKESREEDRTDGNIYEGKVSRYV